MKWVPDDKIPIIWGGSDPYGPTTSRGVLTFFNLAPRWFSQRLRKLLAILEQPLCHSTWELNSQFYPWLWSWQNPTNPKAGPSSGMSHLTIPYLEKGGMWPLQAGSTGSFFLMESAELLAPPRFLLHIEGIFLFCREFQPSRNPAQEDGAI